MYDVVTTANASDKNVAAHDDVVEELKKRQLGGLTIPTKNLLSALNSPSLHPSELEPPQTTHKVLKSLEDLTISQVKEQQAKDISATIVTALEDKLNNKGINIAPVATVFDFTKFVHYKSEKERSTYAQVHQAFSNRIPSIRYLDYTNPSSNTAQQQ